MLVLTRKLMEKLYIGDNICVTVVRVDGGQVRLGIEAPREVSVVRAELLSSRAPHLLPPAPLGAESTLPVEPYPVRTSPPSEPRGTGIRRRGPSR